MKLKKHRFLLFAFIILLTACSIRLSETAVRNMLEVILKDDLAVIIDGILPEALLDEPYYEYSEFSEFSEGMFQYLAVVDFYFLKDIRQKIVRKYRYNKRHLRWERFYNAYESF